MFSVYSISQIFTSNKGGNFWLRGDFYLFAAAFQRFRKINAGADIIRTILLKAPLVKGGWFWLYQNRGDSVEITG